MGKIGFITVRYGLDVTGGAEFHCRMLAERIAGQYDVEVLTTTVKDYTTFIPEVKEGTYELNGVKIRRFDNNPFNRTYYEQLQKKSKKASKIRRLIYRLNLSNIIFPIFPIWNYQKDVEYKLMKNYGFYSDNLLNYLKEHKDEYDALIFITYENALTQLGDFIAPEKTILIPTAHLESMLFRSINSHLFTKVGFIAFNTDTERKMCQKIFQHKLAPNDVVSVGVDITSASKEEIEKVKDHFPKQYLLFCGRIVEGKLNNFLDYFLAFKNKYNTDLKLVLTGDLFMPKVEHPDIIYTGFVTESEKTALIMNSFAVVNPSIYESLSLIALEALSLGKMVIANKKCNVMIEHEAKSNGALICYKSENNLHKILLEHIENPSLMEEKGRAGIKYVSENYQWDVIIDKLLAVIEKFKLKRL